MSWHSQSPKNSDRRTWILSDWSRHSLTRNTFLGEPIELDSTSRQIDRRQWTSDVLRIPDPPLTSTTVLLLCSVWRSQVFCQFSRAPSPAEHEHCTASELRGISKAASIHLLRTLPAAVLSLKRYLQNISKLVSQLLSWANCGQLSEMSKNSNHNHPLPSSVSEKHRERSFLIQT